MLNLSGYQILTHLYESSSSIVYRGIRQTDNQAVIVKVLKQDYPAPAELTRYQQEYEILRSLNLDSVIKAYSLETAQNTLAIIFEDFGGLSLRMLMDERKFTLSEFLHIAIQITDSLGNIHEANIIHKDINPSNIVFNPETGQLKIIDFGLATRLTSSHPNPNNPKSLEGTLAYISPEQTGRMNRTLDYRTDFYSLGVTFYELLTHKLPFATNDAIELVHCHLAKQPLPACEVSSEIPQPVSNIVMKLLAKNAEERYQSAWGIKADLVVCLMQLEANGVIENIVPGQHEIFDQFQIPQRLYGREQEIEVLLAALERVVAGRKSEGLSRKDEGGTGLSPQTSSKSDFYGEGREHQTHQHFNSSSLEMMLVTGDSGIGKSALIHEIEQAVRAKQGYFISGKFEPSGRTVPYAAVINAFQGLVQQLLTESEVQLQQWREKILAALGSQGQLINDVIPELELIIGQQPPMPELGATESQNRFNQVFQTFIRVFVYEQDLLPKAPLVMFLDDLQWADSASLELIELMLLGKTHETPTRKTPHSLFFIGAYRDSEVYPLHPLIRMIDQLHQKKVVINQIPLIPLGIAPIRQLIADTFHINKIKGNPLAELVLQKTKGNPFLIKEFLYTLYAEKAIRFDSECLGWQWDMAQIEARDIPANRVELISRPLNQCPESTQQLTPITHSRALTNTNKKTSITSTSKHSGEILDLSAVMQAAQAISSEIVLDTLLTKMMRIIIENAGAEKGFFLREKAGQWEVEVSGAIALDGVTVRVAIPLCAQAQSSEDIPCVDLPRSIINYVARTRENIVLGDAVKQGAFTQDDYILIQQPKSILCTPIQSQGKLIGLLYLENNLTSEAFTPERLSILTLLCSQAAIALENAQLYEKLENYSRILEIKVEERTQELRQEISKRQLLSEKLHTSESKMRAVFTAMTDIVLIIDVQGNIEIVPTNSSSLYDSNPDIINSTIEQFFQEEKAENWWRQIRRTLETKQTLNFDYSLRWGDHEFWFTARISPMSNHSVIWVARDISDRKFAEEALRQSEEKFARAFRSSPCAITLTKLSDGRHIEVNDSFCQFTGYTRDEIIGRTALELNLWVNLQARDHMLQILQEQGTLHNYEFDFRTKFNTIRTALLSVEVINFYGQSCLISVSQDISDRKQAQAALQRAKEAAEAATKAADTANRAKSEFLANMSHELRTPLNAILGFSQLMHRDAHLNPSQQENLAIIMRSGEHLLTLINQVLDLSKIEAGRLTLNPHNFDLYRLLDDLEDMFRLRARDKQLQLLFERAPNLPQYVCTDEVKLRQILINLLNNAIKFTESGGVSVRVGMMQGRGGTAQPQTSNLQTAENFSHAQLQFEVEDTGIGIAAEEIDSLFEAFVQAKSGRISPEGTGLGLAIARQFVQLLGGDITLSSTLGHGSLFKFYLQVSIVDFSDIPTQQATRRVMALEPNQPRYRILIVDDRWENRQLLLKLLHPLGFELQQASNGLEALDIWERWQPHLIWMDMRMPVMDGYEATQRIKATIKGQATAVIALTASTLEEERAVILSAGCDDFVRKPFREVDIFETIQKHLGLSYIYDAPTHSLPEQANNSNTLTASALATVPVELLTHLKQAATRIDMDKIDTLIDEIRCHHAFLAERLAILAADFKYDEILAFLQQASD